VGVVWDAVVTEGPFFAKPCRKTTPIEDFRRLWTYNLTRGLLKTQWRWKEDGYGKKAKAGRWRTFAANGSSYLAIEYPDP
jgi:hypothetical protein